MTTSIRHPYIDFNGTAGQIRLALSERALFNAQSFQVDGSWLHAVGRFEGEANDVAMTWPDHMVRSIEAEPAY